MYIQKFSLVDLKVEIPAVEETKEGLLSGGFTSFGSDGFGKSMVKPMGFATQDAAMEYATMDVLTSRAITNVSTKVVTVDAQMPHATVNALIQHAISNAKHQNYLSRFLCSSKSILCHVFMTQY